MLKKQNTEGFPSHVAWQNSIEIPHSEFDSVAGSSASNVLRFMPRSPLFSRRPLTPSISDPDSFFNILAAAMSRKSVTAHMESF
jgi:hypothetical protein